MNNIPLLLSWSLLALTSLVQADGQLMVMPARSTVEGMSNRTVQVSNVGDKPLYLKVDLVRIENPGENPERKTAIGEVPHPELMASPTKLTLGPGQKRDLNLVALKSPIRETLYRLYIVPVSSIKIVGNESREKISAPITFGVAYGVLVHHQPPTGAQIRGWEYKCVTGGLQLTATGNVYTQLSQLQAEPTGGLSDEQKVFPGTPLIVPVKTLKGLADGQMFNVRCP